MRWKWLRNGLLGLGMLVVAGFLARDFLFFTFLYRGTRADWELIEIRHEMDVVRREFDEIRPSDASETEVQAQSAKFAAKETRLRQRCLKLAEENPGTRAELGALYVVAGEWPETEEGKHALQTLIQVSETANLHHLGETLESIHATHKESMRPLIPVFLRLESENSTHTQPSY